MANNTIVISRIQNRRGRRENLPQPLLPGEIALTADTGEVWIGSDPNLSVPATRVYKDQLQATAQSIIDNSIVEAVFTQDFTPSDLATLIVQLSADNTVTLVADDIEGDDTYRGAIITITVTTPGTGYTSGNTVTAVSPTGSGFTGVVVDNGSGGISSITITNPGRNYFAATTTFSISGGSGGVLTVTVDDIHGYSVFIAANTDVDPANTITNVVTAVDNTGPGGTSGITGKHGALGGPVRYPGLGGHSFIGDVLLLDTQKESAAVTNLINRVHSSVPGAITGLVHTTLNLEVTASGGASGTLDDLSDVVITSVTDNEVLAFDSGSGNWINQTAAEANLASIQRVTFSTSDATPHVTDYSVGASKSQIFVAKIYGRDTATGDTYWSVQKFGVSTNGGSTVTIVGSPVVDLGYSAGASTWLTVVTSSTTFVRFTITGEAATNIDWVIQLEIA